MATFREARKALLFAYQDGNIDDTEFDPVYDLNSSKISEKNDIHLLGEVLGIPDVIMKCPNCVLVDEMETLSVLLKRFGYPCRFAEMVARFGRPVPQLCMITNRVIHYVLDEYSHPLAHLNQLWLSRDRLRHFAATIHDKGAPLENCWGFIDGKARPLCKPHQNQRILHNRHKMVHGIKFQSVVASNGIISSLLVIVKNSSPPPTVGQLSTNS